MLSNLGWTDERVSQLKELWALGASCSQIAAKIGGISRNSVIGKANRLGLERRKVVKSAPKPKGRRKWKPKRPVMDLFEDTLPPIDFIGIQFAETNQFTCMYPEGDGSHMLFCGQPRKDGSSYCPTHYRLCHQKPTGPTVRYWKTWGRAA